MGSGCEAALLGRAGIGGQRVKDVRCKADKACHRKGGTSIGNVLLRDHITGDHYHSRISAVGLGPRKKTVDRILPAMLEYNRSVRDRRTIQNARHRRVIVRIVRLTEGSSHGHANDGTGGPDNKLSAAIV